VNIKNSTKKHKPLNNIVSQRLLSSKRDISIAVLCMFGFIAMTLLIPWPIKFIFDYVLLADDPGISIGFFGFYLFTDNVYVAISVLSVAVVVIALMRGFFSYYQSFITARLGNNIVFKLRCELFSHLQSLPLSFHQRSQAGDTLAKLTADTNALKDVFSESIMTIFTQLLLIIGIFIVMFMMNWKLSVIVFITFPVVIVVLYVMYKKLRITVRSQRRQEGKISARVNEVLIAIPLVQTYARENYESDRFNKENELTMEQSIYADRLEVLTTRSADIVTAFGTALVILVGSIYAIQKTLSPGDVLVFVSYVKNIYKPIRSVAKLTTKFSRAIVSMERVSEILNTEPAIADRDDAIVASGFIGKITFSSVGFQYPDSKVNALSDVSFTIFPGQRVALVGPSGAGKSTIAKLVLRLVEPQNGSVLIDDMNIQMFTRNSLREKIGVVLQSPVLFNASIAENIGYGLLDASDEQIKWAARQANADSFIAAFPDGYETVVGERGSMLSGGQQQRISLARALIKKPTILIMDEATSALDAISERAIHKAIDQMQRNKTILMIAHNLQLVKNFDLILVLEKGKIVEQGTHHELLSCRGCYYNLYKAQMDAA